MSPRVPDRAHVSTGIEAQTPQPPDPPSQPIGDPPPGPGETPHVY